MGVLGPDGRAGGAGKGMLGDLDPGGGAGGLELAGG